MRYATDADRLVRRFDVASPVVRSPARQWQLKLGFGACDNLVGVPFLLTTVRWGGPRPLARSLPLPLPFVLVPCPCCRFRLSLQPAPKSSADAARPTLAAALVVDALRAKWPARPTRNRLTLGQSPRPRPRQPGARRWARAFLGAGDVASLYVRRVGEFVLRMLFVVTAW